MKVGRINNYARATRTNQECPGKLGGMLTLPTTCLLMRKFLEDEGFFVHVSKQPAKFPINK
jgi:hypothetical protein